MLGLNDPPRRRGIALHQSVEKGAQADTAKSAELQVIIWFLEAGWELFTPVVLTCMALISLSDIL